MSSLTRRIQRSVKREVHYLSRGSKLGTNNPPPKKKEVKKRRHFHRNFPNPEAVKG